MKEYITYFQYQANKPLLKAIVTLGGRYPEPTHNNVEYQNSHRLLDMEVEFFERWDVGNRKPLLKILWRILIVKYEHSPNWRHMLDWVIMMIPEDWKPFNPHRQMELWRGGK